MFICYNRWLNNNLLPIFTTLILSLFVNTHTANAVSNRDIYNAQVKLQELGYYSGKLDGIYGQKNREAVLNFQHDNGLNETGELDDYTVNKLLPAKGLEKFYKNKVIKEVDNFILNLKKYPFRIYILLLFPFVVTFFLIDFKFKGSHLIPLLILFAVLVCLSFILKGPVMNYFNDLSRKFKIVYWDIVTFKVFVFIVFLYSLINLASIARETLKVFFIISIAAAYIVVTLYIEHLFISLGEALMIAKNNLTLSHFSLDIFDIHWISCLLYVNIFIFFNVVYFKSRNEFNFIKQRILLMFSGYIFICVTVNSNQYSLTHISIAILSISFILLIEPYAVSFVKKILFLN